jgi:DNA-binding MarR family transcriptional regulator
MNCDSQKDLRPHSPTAAASLPPAMVEETGWDILLVLHSDPRCELSLGKLASLASVSATVMHRWLAGLEQRQLITGAKDSFTGELRAVLTSAGRELLDKYLSATSDLQVVTHH